jgi:hypothetical protein
MKKIKLTLCLMTFMILFDLSANAQSNLMFNMPVDGFTETSDPSLNETFDDRQDDDFNYQEAKTLKPTARSNQKKTKNFTVILDGDHWPE